MKNQVPDYSVSKQAWSEYQHELNDVANTIPQKELSSPRGLIPLMVVVQKNKGKVCPVLDYCKLNKHDGAYMAHADVYAEKLKEWRRKGLRVSVLDLHKTYLWICVDQLLWLFQTIIYKGWKYCLTIMGFGLNVAPAITKAIVDTMLCPFSRPLQHILM